MHNRIRKISEQIEKLFYEHHNKRERLEGCHNIGNIDIQCPYCKAFYLMDDQTMPLIKLSL